MTAFTWRRVLSPSAGPTSVLLAAVTGFLRATSLAPATSARWTKVYFSVIQRKLLSPGDFEDLDELAAQILAFEEHYNAAARPFDWRFTRTDLNRLLARVRHHNRHAPQPAAA